MLASSLEWPFCLWRLAAAVLLWDWPSKKDCNQFGLTNNWWSVFEEAAGVLHQNICPKKESLGVALLKHVYYDIQSWKYNIAWIRWHFWSAKWHVKKPKQQDCFISRASWLYTDCTFVLLASEFEYVFAKSGGTMLSLTFEPGLIYTDVCLPGIFVSPV